MRDSNDQHTRGVLAQPDWTHSIDASGFGRGAEARFGGSAGCVARSESDLRARTIRDRNGRRVIVVTWLHRADRDVLEVHPRGDPEVPLAGVFTTRSPHRPNPLGLHRVTVREISRTRLRIGPIEAIDGTPVVRVKPVLLRRGDAS